VQHAPAPPAAQKRVPQPNRLPSSSSSTSVPIAPVPAQIEKQKPKAASKKSVSNASDEPTDRHGKKKGTASDSTKQTSPVGSQSSMIDSMPEEQRVALCQYIYHLMQQKSFTSQEGYLIADVFNEVWKETSDSAEGSRVAQQRFVELLRSAPQYFKLFRRNIQVANHCGWFARKGERMVSLLDLEDEGEQKM
jgi:hypothetical protein